MVRPGGTRVNPGSHLPFPPVLGLPTIPPSDRGFPAVTAPAEPTKKRSWTGVIKYVVGVGLLAFVIGSNWKDKPEYLKGDDGKPFQENGAWVVATDDAGNAKVEQPGLAKLLERQPNWGLYALCGVLCAGVVASQYVRWYTLVRAVDLPFTLRNAFRLGMVGTFYNTFLPGAIGGDLIKAFFIAKDQPAGGRRL